MTTLHPPTPAEYQQMAAATGRLLARLHFGNPMEYETGLWALGLLNLAGAVMVAKEARER